MESPTIAAECIKTRDRIDPPIRNDYNVVKEDYPMPVTSVRLTDEESALIHSYCLIHGVSMSEALKRALIEKIEDEFDLAEYEAAKKDCDKNPVSYSLEEVRKELDL